MTNTKLGVSDVHYFQVGAELPVDSDDAEKENKNDDGHTLLCVFERGCIPKTYALVLCNIQAIFNSFSRFLCNNQDSDSQKNMFLLL